MNGLTNSEVQTIAHNLNEKVNLPLIGEKLEEGVFRAVIREVDYQLWHKTGMDLKTWVSSEGAETKESHATVVAKKLNKLINIPIIGEAKEEHIIKTIILAIFDKVEDIKL